jgi:hypothetical protein
MDRAEGRRKDNVRASRLPEKNNPAEADLGFNVEKNRERPFMRSAKSSNSFRRKEPGRSRLEWRPQAPPKHPQSVEGTAPACPAPHADRDVEIGSTKRTRRGRVARGEIPRNLLYPNETLQSSGSRGESARRIVHGKRTEAFSK